MLNPRLPVSYLFVPGDRPDRFAKASAAGAGAVIIDLEDAVAADAKSAARDQILAWCKSLPSSAARPMVRINDATTAWYADDLALVGACGPSAVMRCRRPKRSAR